MWIELWGHNLCSDIETVDSDETELDDYLAKSLEEDRHR